MLENFSFVSTTTDSTTWDMHRLVQDATQWWLQARGELQTVQQGYIDRLHAVVPTGDFENWQKCQMLLPHVRSVGHPTTDVRETRLIWATIMYRMVRYSMRGCSLVDANEFARASLISRTELLGGEDPDTLLNMMVMAEVCRVRGRWKEAEELDVEVLEISRRVLGLEHPSTLTSMGNLAETYRNQGRLQEAEELQVEVLEIMRRVLGPEHPSTLASMNNLASTYWHQGRWSEAEELKVKVMETSRRVLGAEHPSTLSSMNNLAATYYDQQRLHEASVLAKECLQLRSKVLGATHPDTLTSTEWVKGIEEATQASMNDEEERALAR